MKFGMGQTVASWAAVMCLSGPGAVADEAKGSAEAGHVFANAVCAECHSIEPGAKSSPNVKAPPFATLVKSEKLTPSAIEGWLRSSHASMPDFSVPAEKRADIIAYIESLALKP